MVSTNPAPQAAWAEVARTVLTTPYPYSAAHTSAGPDDVDVTPNRLHPAFHGSFDWHSSVHMHWSLVRLVTVARDDVGDEPAELLALRLTADNIATETAYLRAHPGWERPYGWAWAIMLAAACESSDHSDAGPWAEATQPLAEAVGDLVLAWLPRQVYPVRHGVHGNTAFALALIHHAGTVLGRRDLVTAIEARARDWFLGDRDHPGWTEPSGSDFLSPGLVEAELMRRVLPPGEFAEWFAAFLPDLAAGSRLLDVPEVRDPTDGQLVHLYGLGLSRAWLLRSLARTWAPDTPGRRAVLGSADAQERFGLQAVRDGDFMSTHWLVSFALLAGGLIG